MEIDLVKWAREVVALVPAVEIEGLEIRDREALVSVKIGAAGWKGRLLFRESPADFADEMRAAVAAHLNAMAAHHEIAAAALKARASSATNG